MLIEKACAVFRTIPPDYLSQRGRIYSYQHLFAWVIFITYVTKAIFCDLFLLSGDGGEKVKSAGGGKDPYPPR